MKKCKIEVLKTTFHEDLAKEYGCKNRFGVLFEEFRTYLLDHGQHGGC